MVVEERCSKEFSESCFLIGSSRQSVDIFSKGLDSFCFNEEIRIPFLKVALEFG